MKSGMKVHQQNLVKGKDKSGIGKKGGGGGGSKGQNDISSLNVQVID